MMLCSQVDALWMAKIKESATKHGWTWLHHLHVGTIELEIGNSIAAHTHFQESLKLKVTPHAARALEIFVNASEAPHYFEAAWKAWVAIDASIDTAKFRLGADLAKEHASWLSGQAHDSGSWHDLAAFVDRVERDCGSFCAEQDLMLLAKAKVELYFRKNPQKAIAIIRDNCFPTFSNQRGDVNAVWWAANVAEEEARLQRPMSRMEKIKLRRKLGCDGEDASTHSVPATGGDTCVVGPPNIGYPY